MQKRAVLQYVIDTLESVTDFLVLINLFEEQKKKNTFGEFLKGKCRFHEHTTKCQLDEQYCGQQQESVVSNTGQLPCRVVSNTSFLVLRPIYSHPREG